MCVILVPIKDIMKMKKAYNNLNENVITVIFQGTVTQQRQRNLYITSLSA